MQVVRSTFLLSKELREGQECVCPCGSSDKLITGVT
jgi:hypothetical protein